MALERDALATAVADAVRSGRAIYAGISNYNAAQTRQAAAILKGLGVPLLIHQPVYNMFNRWVEPELLPTLAEVGAGCIPFSPLAQGLLTNGSAVRGAYIRGILPEHEDRVADIGKHMRSGKLENLKPGDKFKFVIPAIFRCNNLHK